MGNPVPISVPLRGLQTLDPFIDFESLYARELTNYTLINGSLKVRPAVRVTPGATSLITKDILWFSRGTGGVDWAGITAPSGVGNVVDIEAGTALGTIVLGSDLIPATTVEHLSLRLVLGIGEPRDQDYPFTAWTFTSSYITTAEINCATSHKGRLYVSQGTTIQYSNVGQVTGALPNENKFIILPFLNGQTIIRMFSVTIEAGNDATSVLVVFCDGGRVLVFLGDYPADPSWKLLSFDMPAPGSNLTFAPINGDILIGTTRYAYWFSDLFSGGEQTAFENRPSAAIDNLWKGLSWINPGFTYIQNESQLFYVESLNIIICQFVSSNSVNLNLIANYGNESGYLIYHLDYKAWSLWLMSQFYQPVRDVGIYGMCGVQEIPSIAKIDEDYMVDQYWNGADTIDFDIETSWKTPYFYPQSGKQKKLNGTTPIFNNTESGYMHLIQAIYNMSDYNAPLGFFTQSTVTEIPPGYVTDGNIDVPAVSWKIYNEFCGVAGDGQGFSLQFTQKRKAASTAEQQQIIYAASLNFEDGGVNPS